MRRYSPAELDWLRENYRHGTVNDTLDAFEAEFGRRPGKYALFQKANKMGLRKDRHGDERQEPAQARIRWSEPKFAEMREWMLEHDAGESVFGTIDAFEREFGIRLNRAQVSRFRSVYGTGKRASHGGGKPSKPVGSERMGKDGYVMVKVKEFPDVPQTKDNWRFKHHLVWEEANGRPVPEGWTVLFADKDKSNFDPGNLVAIPRKYIGQLNNPGLPGYCDRDTLLACMALCDLRSATMDSEAARERTCEVCGRGFRMAEAQRAYPQPVKTCPACRKAGRKAKGERKGRDAAPRRCAVCGDAFAPTSKGERRCPACKAARPKHGVERHREYFERNGHR